MSDYCKKYNRVAWSSPHPKTGIRFFTRLRCKQWSCDYCAELNRRMWIAHILDNINTLTDEDDKWYFVTITGKGGKNRTPEKTLRQCQKAWRGLTELWRLRAKKHGVNAPHYVRVYEQHKDGNVHLHAVICSKIPLSDFKVVKYKKGARTGMDVSLKGFEPRKKARFKDLVSHFGARWVEDIQEIKQANAGLVASYITKYMTKDMQSALSVPKRVRRIQTSSQFSRFGYMEGSDELSWESSIALLYEDYARIRADSKAIKDLQTGDNITIALFDNGTHYPPPDDREA